MSSDKPKLTPEEAERTTLALVKQMQMILADSLASLVGRESPMPTAKYLYYAARHVSDMAEGYVSLREAGRFYATRPLVRSALEVMYRFAAVRANPSFLYRIGYTEHHEDLKMLRPFSKNPNYSAQREGMLGQWRKAKAAFGKAFGEDKLLDQKVSVFDVAKEAHLESDYESFYRYYSQFSHGALRATGATLDGFSLFDNLAMANITIVIIEGIRDLGAQVPDTATLHRRLQAELQRSEADGPIGSPV